MSRRFTRRSVLVWSAGTAAAGLLAACAPAAQPAPTAAPKATEAPKPAATSAPVPAATTSPAVTAAPAATQAPAAATQAPSPKRGGTLTLGSTAGVQEFNPFNATVGHTPFMRAVYNSLARYDAQLNLVPDLAEKWDIAADGKSVTFKLRQGVKFHSGRDFTSADVKASVDFGSTNDRALLREVFKTIKVVETPDNYTVTFRFDAANPGMFDLIDGLYMIDKNTVEDRAKTGIGTGPFKVDLYVPNDRLEMSAFKDFWDKGKPYLDKYIFRQIPDSASLSINLESGAVDLIDGAALTDAARLKAAGGRFLVDPGTPGGTIYDVGMNVKSKPFDNKLVRQAIAWSIDRDRFCKTALQGFSKPTNCIWPTNSWAYFPDLDGKIGFDLDKAKALLAQAGYATGFETTLECSTKVDKGYTDLATILQADLAKIGINAKLLDMDSTVYTNTNQNLQMIFMTHAYGRTTRDPGTTLTGAKAWYLEKEGGWTHIDDPTYAQLKTDLNSTLDRDKRKAICRQIQELALDLCFTVPVANRPRMKIYANYVKNMTYNPDDAFYAGDFWLDK